MEVVDLFSGLGGFSQAFVDRGHTVERYDNDPKFKEIPHTMTIDVLDMTPIDLEHADIILASPPCTCFSFAAQSKYYPKRRDPHAAVREAVHLVKHAISIIKHAHPEYWILENPVGRLRGYIGKPSITTAWCAWGTNYKKPTYLWGKLPPIDWKMARKWEPNLSGGAGNAMPNDPYPRDLAKRALIPYEFSMAVCLAAEGNSPQQTLMEYMT